MKASEVGKETSVQLQGKWKEKHVDIDRDNERNILVYLSFPRNGIS